MHNLQFIQVSEKQEPIYLKKAIQLVNNNLLASHVW